MHPEKRNSRGHHWTVSCKGKQMRWRGHFEGADRSRPFEHVTRRPLRFFFIPGLPGQLQRPLSWCPFGAAAQEEAAVGRPLDAFFRVTPPFAGRSDLPQSYVPDLTGCTSRGTLALCGHRRVVVPRLVRPSKPWPPTARLYHPYEGAPGDFLEAMTVIAVSPSADLFSRHRR